MDKRKIPVNEETNAVREAYAALNRNDISAFLELFDSDIERVELLGAPSGVAYHGLAEMEAHVLKARGAWVEGSCEPERFSFVGDRIVVSVYVHVRLQNETEWRDGRVTDVFTFRNGKVIQFYSFIDEGQALEWAGRRCPDAN